MYEIECHLNNHLWTTGPYFFENEAGITVTVNSERYARMIADFFWPAIKYYELADMWFQQDGATSHTTRPILALLREKFPERVFPRFGAVNWPPRSYDLTLTYFFCGATHKTVSTRIIP